MSRRSRPSRASRGANAEAVRRDSTAKFRDAEQKLRQATLLRPQFSEAWNNLAVAALQLATTNLAATASRNALKDVTYAEPEIARANLGWALFQKKDMQAAWKELHEGRGARARLLRRPLSPGKVYVERAEYDRAADELDGILGGGSARSRRRSCWRAWSASEGSRRARRGSPSSAA